MITALLVDDEEAANHRMRTLLAAHPKIRIIGVVENVAGAEEFLAHQRPDVIFLDMKMRTRSGLELLPSLDSRIAVVFVTAYENYALAAFDAGALDYLVKPVNPLRLQIMVDRLLLKFQSIKPPVKEIERVAGPQLDDFLSIAISGTKEILQCPMSEILWIEAMQNYTQLQFKHQANPVTTRRSINEWIKLLDGKRFDQLGRSLIIQTEMVRSSEWNSRNCTLLTFEGCDEVLSIGRQASVRLKMLLQLREEKNYYVDGQQLEIS